MKILALILGAIIGLISLIKLSKFALDYQILSDYGQGYVWGNILLFAISMFLIFWGAKKKTKYSN